MPRNTGKKVTFLASINCPHCNKKINILKEIEIIVPATPAEKKERFFAEKDAQTTLST